MNNSRKTTLSHWTLNLAVAALIFAGGISAHATIPVAPAITYSFDASNGYPTALNGSTIEIQNDVLIGWDIDGYTSGTINKSSTSITNYNSTGWWGSIDVTDVGGNAAWYFTATAVYANGGSLTLIQPVSVGFNQETDPPGNWTAPDAFGTLPLLLGLVIVAAGISRRQGWRAVPARH
jgi:hypothetical protein